MNIYSECFEARDLGITYYHQELYKSKAKTSSLTLSKFIKAMIEALSNDTGGTEGKYFLRDSDPSKNKPTLTNAQFTGWTVPISESNYEDNKNKIESFRNLPKDWSYYEAEKPNEFAINNALMTLEKLKEINKFPNNINPSLDEGVIFELIIDGNDFVFEFDNNGEIGFLERFRNVEAKAYSVSIDDLQTYIDHIKNV